MPSLIANDTGQGDQKNSNVFFISFRGEEELVKLKDFLLTNWAILHPNHFLMTTCKWRLFRMASSIHQRSNQINAFWSSQLLFSWSLQDRHAFFSFFLLKWAGKRHFFTHLIDHSICTLFGINKLSHRQWRETKEHPIWWLDLALAGCCLILLYSISCCRTV